MGSNIGFLHPGAMGVSLAATALNTGHRAYWLSEGRSADTRKRAEQHGLSEVRTLEEMCEICSVMIAVCPPHGASAVAEQVQSTAFEGVYADVNAIAPARTRAIGRLFSESKATFVDGGIIGGPAWKPDETILYLSGPGASAVAECFASGPLETEIIGNEIGKASALKMCFAANTKGSAALMCAVLAVADKLGVSEDLQRQWSRRDEGYAPRTLEMVSGVSAKAWRFAGEMAEIATTFQDAGLPGGFHSAAEEVYGRIAEFKGADPLPAAEEVIRRLQEPND